MYILQRQGIQSDNVGKIFYKKYILWFFKKYILASTIFNWSAGYPPCASKGNATNLNLKAHQLFEKSSSKYRTALSLARLHQRSKKSKKVIMAKWPLYTALWIRVWRLVGIMADFISSSLLAHNEQQAELWPPETFLISRLGTSRRRRCSAKLEELQKFQQERWTKCHSMPFTWVKF